MTERAAVIGIGSNIGDRFGICAGAIMALDSAKGIRIRCLSSYYLTEPVGPIAQNWFVNLAVSVGTDLPPNKLLARLLRIEKKAGRVRGRTRGEPRELDLDLFFYDNKVIDKPGLCVPHPRLHERRFALVPLLEIVPGARHPKLRKPLASLLRECRDRSRVIRVDGPVPLDDPGPE